LLSTREEVEGMRSASGESINDFAYRWRLKTSNVKHSMSKEDMILTFMRTLGLTYQLMLLTALQSNFSKVVDKAAKVELAIKVGSDMRHHLPWLVPQKMYQRKQPSPSQKLTCASH